MSFQATSDVMIEHTNNKGAISALKGYRVQFLYSLFRILLHKPVETTFIPEGRFEDLDVYDGEGKVIEIIQVKGLGKKVTLSDIISQNENSFLKRALKSHLNGQSPVIKLTTFGEVNEDIKELTQNQFTKATRSKLKKLNVKDAEIGILEKYFTCEIVSEVDITVAIIKELTGRQIFANSAAALDLLIYWIYKSAEKQIKLGTNSLQDKLLSIGKFLNDQVNFNNTFGTIIRPIERTLNNENTHTLQSDFYKGISATYKHILAGADVIRQDKLEILMKKFTESNVVFIHGASGQGKTTLAYRYLYDYCAEQTVYRLILPVDTKSIYEVISTLESIARDIEFPITLFIDVQPGNKGWIDVLNELSSKKVFNFLVAIRQEDWNAVQIADQFSFAEQELPLDEDEASKIYDSLNQYSIDLTFTDFTNAWLKFGGAGPLLEFVYLITQKESLSEKLKTQVNSIQEEATALAAEKLRILRFVSLSDSFGARVKYGDLAVQVNQNTISRVVELLEKEYLIKTTEDRSYISGLHPVRSDIIRKLLFDNEVYYEKEYVLDSLLFIDEDTIYNYLIAAFKRTSLNASELIEKLGAIEIKTWRSYYWYIKSLIWKGIDDYVQKNMSVLSKLFQDWNTAWIVYVDLDVTGMMEGGSMAESLDLFTDEQRSYAKEIRSRFSNKIEIFHYCKIWLATLSKINLCPTSEKEFKAFSLTVFWLRQLGFTTIAIPFEDIDWSASSNCTSPVLAQIVGNLKTYDESSKIQVSVVEPILIKGLYKEHKFDFY